MTTHTPGPWKAVNLQETLNGMTHKWAWAVEPVDPDASVTPVARMALAATPDVTEANAHLIAAAPELLAALKSAQADIERLVDWVSDYRADLGYSPATEPECMSSLRAAIAKAEGRA